MRLGVGSVNSEKGMGGDSSWVRAIQRLGFEDLDGHAFEVSAQAGAARSQQF
jgi:hypothetical protein